MLSVIITHHRTPALLRLCLKSIKENIGALEHEVIITDSQSEEETSNLIKDNFPEVKLIHFINNVGYAKIVNAGIKTAKGDYILILNADILILKESVPKMLEFIKNHPDVGIVGPQLLTFSNQPQNSCFNFPSLGAILARRTFFGKLKWGKKKLNKFLMKNKNLFITKNVDWVQGSAMLARKTAIEKVGLLDERFFMYFEDTDWCRRFWQNGYRVVYLPSVKMSHYYYRVSKKRGGILDIFFNKYTRLHLSSAFKYFWKWRKEVQKPKVKIVYNS